MKNRRGRFTISFDVIDEAPAIVMMVLARCVVVRAESMYMYNGIEYYALSPEFDIVPESVVTPEYRVEIMRDEAGAHSIMFERI